jgi:hypothetical protein
METQKTLISQSNSEKKSNAGGITLPDFKLNYRAITIKTASYWHKNRQEDQWIITEDSDINPHIYSQLIFNREFQNTRWRKDSLQQMLLEKRDIHMQKTEAKSLSFTLYQNQLNMDQKP